MVSLLSSPAMPSILLYCLLFYLYRDIRVLHSRGLIDHIRILPFQMHFISFLGSGGYFGILTSQVPSWRCLAQKMLLRCSILQNTASKAPPAWQSLRIHIDAELQSQLWLVHPTDFHSCERCSNHWPQVGAGHPDMPTDTTWHSVLLYCFTPLCVPSLSGSLFPFYVIYSSVWGLTSCAYPEISTTGSCSLWPSRQDNAKTISFTKCLSGTIVSCNSLNTGQRAWTFQISIIWSFCKVAVKCRSDGKKVGLSMMHNYWVSA